MNYGNESTERLSWNKTFLSDLNTQIHFWIWSGSLHLNSMTSDISNLIISHCDLKHDWMNKDNVAWYCMKTIEVFQLPTETEKCLNLHENFMAFWILK